MWSLILWGGIGFVVAAATLFSVLVGKIKEAKRTSKQPQCYYCGNLAVRPSAPNGIFDWILESGIACRTAARFAFGGITGSSVSAPHAPKRRCGPSVALHR